MERLRDLYVLKRRTFLGLMGAGFTMLMSPPIWARRKLRKIVTATRLGQPASPFAPVIQLVGGQTGTWPSYGTAY